MPHLSRGINTATLMNERAMGAEKRDSARKQTTFIKKFVLTVGSVQF